MDERLMQLGQIGRLKTKNASLDDKRRKMTYEEIKAKQVIAVYNDMDKQYSAYKRKEKDAEFLKRLKADPKPNSKPNTKPIGQSQNRQRAWS